MAFCNFALIDCEGKMYLIGVGGEVRRCVHLIVVVLRTGYSKSYKWAQISVAANQKAATCLPDVPVKRVDFIVLERETGQYHVLSCQ